MILIIGIIVIIALIFEASPGGHYNSSIDGEFDEAGFGGRGGGSFD